MINTTTTSTDTSTTSSCTYPCPYLKPKAEKGWECPRCGRINAPWVRQCDCSRDNNDGHRWVTLDFNEPWWKHYVTCNSDTFRIHPESGPIWATPNSTCGEGDNILNTSSTYSTASNPVVGGSDYWNPITKTYENVSSTQASNKPDPNSSTTLWNNGYTTKTIHNGKTNYKE